MPFTVVGHRGAAGHAPENTLRSVEAALRLGVDAVEVDVHHVDGQLVVIHDERLERTTNGTGRVADHTFAALRALDAGGGERIPTLDEVLDLVGGGAELVVELKGAETALAVVRRLQAIGDGRGDGVIVSSFDHPELARVHAALPTVRLGALHYGVPRDLAAGARTLGAHAVHLALDFAPAAFVHDAHRRGLQVWVYTVNRADDLARVRALGVDGVFTDVPDVVRAAMEG